MIPSRKNEFLAMPLILANQAIVLFNGVWIGGGRDKPFKLCLQWVFNMSFGERPWGFF